MLSIVKQMIRNNTSFYIFLIGALLMLSCTHSNLIDLGMTLFPKN